MQGFTRYPELSRRLPGDYDHGCGEPRLSNCCQVRINELVDGPICRVGLLWDEDHEEWRFVAGDNRRAIDRVDYAKRESYYWLPLWQGNVLHMLTDLSGESTNVVLHGWLCGPGFGLTYGLDRPSWRLFDITFDGEFCDWEGIVDACSEYDVLLSPTLYEGEWRDGLLEAYVCGVSHVSHIPGELRKGVFMTNTCYGRSTDCRAHYESISPTFRDLRLCPRLLS